MLEIKGLYNTRYQLPQSTLTQVDQVKVIKPDGKEFYIPIVDICSMYQTMELLNQSVHLKQKLQAKGIVL